MAEHVEKIGEILKKQREARGISLKEIADATKISKRFLEAIEQDDWKTLPAPVFTRGFIRAYAKYVDADEDVALGQYAAILEAERIAEEGGPAEAPPIPPPRPMPFDTRSREIPRPYRRIDRNLILLVVILVAFVAFGYWVKQRMSRPAPPLVTPVAAEVTAAPVPPPAQPVPVSGLQMKVQAVESTWLAIIVDGRPYFSDEMRAGETRTINASERIVFQTIGNAGGVSLTLNGRELAPLGESGRVIHDKVYDLESPKTTTP